MAVGADGRGVGETTLRGAGRELAVTDALGGCGSAVGVGGAGVGVGHKLRRRMLQIKM